MNTDSNPTILLTAPLRFRVASSNVTFKDSEGYTLDNEVFNKAWANLTEGCKLEQVFACDTPDLYMWKVTTPPQDNGEALVYGVAVRNASNEKILAAG